jgi:hypothetical protein
MTDASAGGSGDEQAAQAAAAAQGGAPAAGAEAGKGAQGGDAGQPAGQQSAGAGNGKTTIASGGAVAAEEKPTEEQAKPYWPEDWREKAVEGVADKKEQERILAQLKRYIDPAAVINKNRELEAKLSEGGRIKIPGKDAKPEEVAAYHKALGVPEKSEDYLQHIKLENGAVIGELDKPVLSSVLGVLHEAGATPAIANALVNWHYKSQQAAAEKIEEQDHNLRIETERALRAKLGDTYQRRINSIGNALAEFHPRGLEGLNEWLEKRGDNFRVRGNDPEIVEMLMGLAQRVNPVASATPDGSGNAQTLEAELAEIKKLRSADPRKYNTAAVQAREVELIELLGQDKRNRAA